jgi:hypothetical protein
MTLLLILIILIMLYGIWLMTENKMTENKMFTIIESVSPIPTLPLDN